MKRVETVVAGLISLVILINTTALGQKKYDKLLNKAEASYKVGDYSKAEAGLEKFRKKTNKLGKVNKYTPTYHYTKAKYNLAYGLVFDFESSAKEAVKTSITAYTEQSEKHGLMLIDVAELYNQNGSYRLAREHMEKAEKILKAGNYFNEANQARFDVVFGETLTGQGFFNQALEKLQGQEKYFTSRAVKQESYSDGKGGLKSRKLSEEEVMVRFNDFARWMTSQATALRKQGDLLGSDLKFTQAGTWIKRNLGGNSLAYIKNQVSFSDQMIENGFNPDKYKWPLHAEGYADALNNLKVQHKASHYLGVEIYEKLLKVLMDFGSSARYTNTKLEYEKVIEKEFKKGSIYTVRLKAVEFNSKLDKDKTRNLEKDANNVTSDNKNLPHNNITSVNVIMFLYDLAIQQKNYKGAEKYLKDIVEIKADLLGEAAPETHLSRLKLANFYLSFTNNLDEAAKIYEESYFKVVSKEIKERHIDHLDLLNNMGILFELTDNYTKAEEALTKASNIAVSKYDRKEPLYAVALTKSANLRLKLGQYEKAGEELNTARKILEEERRDEEWKPALIKCLDVQAKLFGLKGLFDDAEDNLDRSAKIIRKSDNLVLEDELSTANELSTLFIQLGRYATTERLLNKLIAEYEQTFGANSIRLVEPLVNKGNLLLAQGEYTDADKIAQRAYKVAVEVFGDQSTKSAPAQKLLGDLYYTLGDYDRSEDYIMKTMMSQQKQFGLEHVEVAKSLAQLALIRFAKGDDHREVEGILNEAKEIIGKRLGVDNPQYAEVLKNVAILYIADKKYQIAFSSLTQAETIWRTKTGTKNSIKAASIFALTGDVYYQIKNFTKAEEFYNKGKDIYEKSFNRSHPEYVKLLSKLGKVNFMKKDYKRSKSYIEEALNNYDKFIKEYFPALSEREKAKYWNTMKPDFEFYNTLAFSQLEDFRDLAGKVYNYQLLTKALLLSSSLKIRERILNSNDENLKASYNLWVQKKELLTHALSMSQAQLIENEIDPGALSNEVEKLEKELSQLSELFGQGFENKKITYENVQKSLGKNEVAVEMLRFRYFDHTFTDSVIYVALYVKNDNARPKVIELPEGHRMETRYFKYFRNSIQGKMQDQFSYKVFWEPIQKEIGQYATIYISPDGVYNQINLESIPTPDGKYVIDNSNIVIINNTKDLYLKKLKGKPMVSGNSATMFGNPTFYAAASSKNTIPSLPGTEKEINELQVLLKGKGWKTDEFTEGTASEERVKEIDNPKIFHIATHGFYSPATVKTSQQEMTESEQMMAENPLLKSGLLLKGAGDLLSKTSHNYNMESGVLTAYEAMNLNLDQTDLVVLSACETGLGEISNGEGVYGLQRAFLVAGAKVLIMSMFKVDDEATQKLILNFYKKWVVGGQPLRQSFVDAKKELRVEYPEPIFWGAFMMIGLD